MSNPETALILTLQRSGRCAANYFYTNGSHVTSPPLEARTPEEFYSRAKAWFVCQYGETEWGDVDTVLPAL